LATALSARILDHLTDTAAGDIERADGLAAQALAASHRSPLAHYAKGQVRRAQNRYAEAIVEYETAIAFDRNWVRAYALIAWCKLYTGPIEEAILLVEQAIRLSPRDPVIGIWYMLIGQAHLLQSRSDEAVFWLEKARSAIPAHRSGLPRHNTTGSTHRHDRGRQRLGGCRSPATAGALPQCCQFRRHFLYGIPIAVNARTSSEMARSQSCRRIAGLAPYPPAEQWLQRNVQVASVPKPDDLKQMFARFIDERRQAMGNPAMSQLDKDALFQQFQSWQRGQRQ
jgi:tetratricopeptide (TPR) repeat protein